MKAIEKLEATIFVGTSIDRACDECSTFAYINGIAITFKFNEVELTAPANEYHPNELVDFYHANRARSSRA